MEILLSILEKLHEQVKKKFEKDMIRYDIKEIPSHVDPFWNVTYDNQPLFHRLIGKFNPLFLWDKIEFKPSYIKLEKKVTKIRNVDYIGCYLKYLEYPGENFDNKFNSFLETVTPEEKLFQQKLKQLEKSKPREDIEELLQAKARYLSKLYTERLLGQNFWLFFYGYDKFKGVTDDEEDKWPLVKLLFKFTDKMVGDYDIKVELDNTDDSEHYDYTGRTDFLTSREEVLVINCRTYPDLLRQLNIKIHIGTCDGDIFLGQYMNYESEGRIISGNILLQKIVDDSDPTPFVHHVPKLKAGEKMYTEDFDGVNKNILQYLHDKKQNFRRTSLRAGHNLTTLEKWLKHHHAKPHGSLNF